MLTQFIKNQKNKNCWKNYKYKNAHPINFILQTPDVDKVAAMAVKLLEH